MMEVPNGYVAFVVKGRDQSLFWARPRFKRLGGYWDPTGRRWLVPLHNAADAKAAIRYAKKVKRELTEAEARGGTASSGPLPFVTAAEMGRPEIRITCYECGRSYTPTQIVARGGVLDEWYCGCEEPANNPALRRRSFVRKDYSRYNTY